MHCVFQLEELAEGGSLFVDYASVVDIAILATTRHPTGKDTAFHLSKTIMGDDYLSESQLIRYTFYVHPMIPWFTQFNTHLQWLHDCGTWHEFKKQTEYVLTIKVLWKSKFCAAGSNLPRNTRRRSKDH